MKIINDPGVVEVDRRAKAALLQQVHKGLGRVVGHGEVFGNAQSGIELGAGAGQDGVGNPSALFRRPQVGIAAHRRLDRILERQERTVGHSRSKWSPRFRGGCEPWGVGGDRTSRNQFFATERIIVTRRLSQIAKPQGRAPLLGGGLPHDGGQQQGRREHDSERAAAFHFA